LAAAEKCSRFVFTAFFNSPCYKTPKNAPKNKLSKTTEGEKKAGGKKAAFFVMSPDGFFRISFYRVLELPLSRNSQKRDK
jgi:hypothetical protein